MDTGPLQVNARVGLRAGRGWNGRETAPERGRETVPERSGSRLGAEAVGLA